MDVQKLGSVFVQMLNIDETLPETSYYWSANMASVHVTGLVREKSALFSTGYVGLMFVVKVF